MRGRPRRKGRGVTWNPVPAEITTGLSDGVLALMAIALLLAVRRRSESDPWKAALWSWLLLLLAVASTLGAVAHALDLAEATRDLLWEPLYFCLGLVVALFFVAALRDRLGERAARLWLPWAVAVGVGFYGVTRLGSGTFLVFIAYETVAMLGALLLFADTARRRLVPGAAWMVLGVALNLVAAAVQQTDLSVRIGALPFDHNGLFHLVQMAAIGALAAGLLASLDGDSPAVAPDAGRT